MIMPTGCFRVAESWSKVPACFGVDRRLQVLQAYLSRGRELPGLCPPQTSQVGFNVPMQF